MTPFMTREIENEKEYFGRDSIISSLISNAHMGQNKQIIGLRRSGKTSLLRIIENKLKHEAKPMVYPIFFNFKQVGNIIKKGTEFVYKYFIAQLIAHLFKDEIFINTLNLRKLEIMPSSLWEDIFDFFINVSQPKTMAVFEDLIELSAKQTNKCILFLIDEYEYLIKEGFDTPEGFVPMRELASKTTPEGKKHFSFWIAGAINWFEMCTLIGSPQLNVIDSDLIYLGPIDRKSFHAMWEYELSFCQDNEKRQILSEKEETAFKLSGGLPNFAKQIGLHFLDGKEDPDISFFSNSFMDMYHLLNEPEKQFLGKLAKEPQKDGNPSILVKLIETGIVKKQDQQYEINIPYFKSFINTLDLPTENPLILEARNLAEKAEEHIISINTHCDNLKRPIIFELPYESGTYWKDIKTLCMSKKDFSGFSRALYLIICETTKGYDKYSDKYVTLNRIPDTFKTPNRDFFDMIDTLRQVFVGHIQSKLYRGGIKKSYPDILETLLGSKNEPQTTEEFQKMQIEVLKSLEKTMKDLLQFVQKQWK